ncbi:conserved protein, unknown function [Hepatocystis sp. ex Piliocolobus tephrosceles]|nr:conserved protein, unknown function [Hepatocystis sp. ex Piliocolobus tephrosceles]
MNTNNHGDGGTRFKYIKSWLKYTKNRDFYKTNLDDIENKSPVNESRTVSRFSDVDNNVINTIVSEYSTNVLKVRNKRKAYSLFTTNETNEKEQYSCNEEYSEYSDTNIAINNNYIDFDNIINLTQNRIVNDTLETPNKNRELTGKIQMENINLEKKCDNLMYDNYMNSPVHKVQYNYDKNYKNESTYYLFNIDESETPVKFLGKRRKFCDLEFNKDDSTSTREENITEENITEENVTEENVTEENVTEENTYEDNILFDCPEIKHINDSTKSVDFNDINSTSSDNESLTFAECVNEEKLSKKFNNKSNKINFLTQTLDCNIIDNAINCSDNY